MTEKEKKCTLIFGFVIGLVLLVFHLISPEMAVLFATILMPIGIVCGLIVIIRNIRRDIKWLKYDNDENQSK